MIYKRQKILLNILSQKESKVSKIKLMKWIFLLFQETEISDIVRFYEFVPYDFGPFSFSAYRDILELQREGLINQDEKSIWCEKERIEKKLIELPKNILNSVSKVLNKYGDLSQTQLLEYIYKKYPWYAKSSKFPHNTSTIKSISPIAIYTLGYESFTIDGFLNFILFKGLRAIVDVRNNAISRKYGFSEKSLLRLCNRLNIKYFHFPKLGIPSSYRANIHSFTELDYTNLWDLYEKEILDLSKAKKEKLIGIIKNQPSSIFCYEKDPVKCHRNRLSSILSKETGLEIIHL